MKPLEGVKVLEFSTMITASFAAMMMAEQGAQVIKVEPVELGDPMRYLGSNKGGISGLFANCNRGKQSLRIDIKSTAGVDIVKQLAADTDVVLCNFRPGVMDGLGLGSNVLRESNPRLIYMAVSGFGTEGPDRDKPAYDPVIQAQSGFAAVQGQGQDGRWTGRSPHDDWVVEAASVRLSLKPTPFGHLGIFPEQIQNWNWIQSLPGDLSGLEALNLFAYTGGTTMALARRGARVTHVDSARPVVRWARKNAELNGLADAPVRWIVEDAMRYVERELRRGRRYDIVVADPPAFGHGPRKRGWEFHRDLPELLLRMGDLTGDRPTAVLITGHTPGVDDRTLAEMVADAFAGVSQAAIDHGPMQIRSASGRVLPAGYFARYCASN